MEISQAPRRLTIAQRVEDDGLTCFKRKHQLREDKWWADLDVDPGVVAAHVLSGDYETVGPAPCALTLTGRRPVERARDR